MSQVNHPSHYNGGEVEVIDLIEEWGLGFCLGNAVKYICRSGRKGGIENRRVDLEKAAWYLNRAIEKGEVVYYSITRDEPKFYDMGVPNILNTALYSIYGYANRYNRKHLEVARFILEKAIDECKEEK